MNIFQVIFLLLLSASLIGVYVFSVTVYQWAKKRDGGAYSPIARLVYGKRTYINEPETSRWAAYIHRITGVSIGAFLLLHILDVAVFAFSPSSFDQLHEIYSTLPMRLFECGLLFALLFHALNGLRLIFVDLLDLDFRRSNQLLVAMSCLVLVVTLFGSYVILMPVIG